MVELEERYMSRMQAQAITAINAQIAEQNICAIEYLLENIKRKISRKGVMRVK